MQFNLNEAMDILGRTPAVLRTMIAGLPEPWVRNNYGESTFSAFDVVGHLICCEETDWMPRLRMCFKHGTDRAFDPFDRYGMYERDKGKSLAELLDTFAAFRAENLAALAAMNLTAADLSARGRHPALGEVTAEQLLATWVVHDLNHIAQVAKAMAYQYIDQVGPWTAYLSILKPPNPAA